MLLIFSHATLHGSHLGSIDFRGEEVNVKHFFRLYS
jgi:hypothetical protein